MRENSEYIGLLHGNIISEVGAALRDERIIGVLTRMVAMEPKKEFY